MLKLMNNQFLLIAPITCPKFDAVILLRTAAHNEFLRWPVFIYAVLMTFSKEIIILSLLQ